MSSGGSISNEMKIAWIGVGGGLVAAVVGALVGGLMTARNPGLSTVLGASPAPSPSPVIVVSSSPSPSPVPVDDQGATIDTGDFGIRHKGTVTLVRGTGLDLDSLDTDPQWGMRGDDRRWDVGWGYAGGFGGTGCSGFCMNTADWLIPTSQPSYKTCHETTGYVDGHVPLGKLRSGLQLCLALDSGRYASVKLGELKSTGSPLVITVVTYKKDGD